MIKKLIQTLIIVSVYGLLFSGCEQLNLPYFKPSVPPDPCDPASSLYEHGHHYIDRDMINRDGQVDPMKLFQAVDPKNSPCNPLNSKSSDETPLDRRD